MTHEQLHALLAYIDARIRELIQAEIADEWLTESIIGHRLLDELHAALNKDVSDV